jgi:hypothetical protein
MSWLNYQDDVAQVVALGRVLISSDATAAPIHPRPGWCTHTRALAPSPSTCHPSARTMRLAGNSIGRRVGDIAARAATRSQIVCSNSAGSRVTTSSPARLIRARCPSALTPQVNVIVISMAHSVAALDKRNRERKETRDAGPSTLVLGQLAQDLGPLVRGCGNVAS